MIQQVFESLGNEDGVAFGGLFCGCRPISAVSFCSSFSWRLLCSSAGYETLSPSAWGNLFKTTLDELQTAAMSIWKQGLLLSLHVRDKCFPAQKKCWKCLEYWGKSWHLYQHFILLRQRGEAVTLSRLHTLAHPTVDTFNIAHSCQNMRIHTPTFHVDTRR